MKKIYSILTLMLIMGVLINLSCKKEISCENCDTNKPPIAAAGPDKIISLPLDSVVLDGSASSDPDGSIDMWLWKKISGPASSSIIKPSESRTVVRNLAVGTYQFELKVSDNGGSFAMDTIQIAVNDPGQTGQSPVANAGADQTITWPGNTVNLDGSSSTDPDNNITSYTWSKISGPASSSFTNANAVQTQVTNLAQGDYKFELKVTDATGLTGKDTVQVTVDPETNNSIVDIYVSGMENNLPVYWKNGQSIPLNNDGSENGTSSIAVVGTDVYVAGWEGDSFMYGHNKAKYWKNGQEVLLTAATGAGATSIAVASGDVYVAGWEFERSRTVAKYWKNGKPVNLTDGLTDAEATSIVVVGSDVYVAGYDNGPIHNVAKYWKNGQAVRLTDGSHQAYAYSIAVVGNDVYVAGSESNGTAHVAKYWKNGRAVALTNGSVVGATATSIAVVGTDVYVAGWEGDFVGRAGGSGSVAKYWKNGQEVSLTGGATYAYASSIAVVDSDVYVAGTEINASNYTANYWKNGQPIQLRGNSASSIVVVKR